jgi:hypothetical protein
MIRSHVCCNSDSCNCNYDATTTYYSVGNHGPWCSATTDNYSDQVEIAKQVTAQLDRIREKSMWFKPRVLYPEKKIMFVQKPILGNNWMSRRQLYKEKRKKWTH